MGEDVKNSVEKLAAEMGVDQCVVINSILKNELVKYGKSHTRRTT